MGLTAMLQLMLLMTNVQRSHEHFVVCLLEDDGLLRLCTVKSIASLKVQSLAIKLFRIIYDLFVSGNIICEECESDM